jgi:hypothetical protein
MQWRVWFDEPSIGILRNYEGKLEKPKTSRVTFSFHSKDSGKGWKGTFVILGDKWHHYSYKIIFTVYFFLFNQPIERLLKELNASEESWVQTKVQPFVAPTSINMLRITLVSVIQLTEYLLNNGFDSVMTGKYNQDCLEVNIGFFQKNKIWLTEFTYFNKIFSLKSASSD